MDNVRSANNYEDDFNSDVYSSIYHNKEFDDSEDGIVSRFYLNALDDLFRQDIQMTGGKLLDIGTGTSVNSIITASRYVQKVHLSDLLPRHIKKLQRWLDGEEMDIDAFKYIRSRENDGTTLEERQQQVRSKVKKISLIDVTQNQPSSLDQEKDYDVIISLFCLEVAAHSLPEYYHVVQNVSSLLKQGGLLVIAGSLGEQFYMVGSVKFWNANINEDELRAVYDKLGFKTIFWREFRFASDAPNIKNRGTFSKLFVMAAIMNESNCQLSD